MNILERKTLSSPERTCGNDKRLNSDIMVLEIAGKLVEILPVRAPTEAMKKAGRKEKIYSMTPFGNSDVQKPDIRTIKGKTCNKACLNNVAKLFKTSAYPFVTLSNDKMAGTLDNDDKS